MSAHAHLFLARAHLKLATWESDSNPGSTKGPAISSQKLANSHLHNVLEGSLFSFEVIRDDQDHPWCLTGNTVIFREGSRDSALLQGRLFSWEDWLSLWPFDFGASVRALTWGKEAVAQCQSGDQLAQFDSGELEPFVPFGKGTDLAPFRGVLSDLARDERRKFAWPEFQWPTWSALLSLYPVGFLGQLSFHVCKSPPRNPPGRNVVFEVADTLEPDTLSDGFCPPPKRQEQEHPYVTWLVQQSDDLGSIRKTVEAKLEELLPKEHRSLWTNDVAHRRLAELGEILLGQLPIQESIFAPPAPKAVVVERKRPELQPAPRQLRFDDFLAPAIQGDRAVLKELANLARERPEAKALLALCTRESARMSKLTPADIDALDQRLSEQHRHQIARNLVGILGDSVPSDPVFDRMAPWFVAPAVVGEFYLAQAGYVYDRLVSFRRASSENAETHLVHLLANWAASPKKQADSPLNAQVWSEGDPDLLEVCARVLGRVPAPQGQIALLRKFFEYSPSLLVLLLAAADSSDGDLLSGLGDGELSLEPWGELGAWILLRRLLALCLIEPSRLDNASPTARERLRLLRSQTSAAFGGPSPRGMLARVGSKLFSKKTTRELAVARITHGTAIPESFEVVPEIEELRWSLAHRCPGDTPRMIEIRDIARYYDCGVWYGQTDEAIQSIGHRLSRMSDKQLQAWADSSAALCRKVLENSESHSGLTFELAIGCMRAAHLGESVR